MGLFSSKKEYKASTLLQRVIEDKKLPNSIKTGVNNYIFSSEGQTNGIPEFVMEELVISVGAKAERMYTFGKDKYEYGLPGGQFKSPVATKNLVKAVLDQVEGKPVTIEYSHLTPPNSLHLAWMQAVVLYGYNPVTNQLSTLSTQKTTPVYLEDLIINVPKADLNSYRPGALAQWGMSAKAGTTLTKEVETDVFNNLIAKTPIHTDINSAFEYAELKYSYLTLPNTTLSSNETESQDKKIRFGKLKIPLNNLVIEDADYIHTKYKVNGLIKYVSYKPGTGTYPTLDALVSTKFATSGTFFPFGYFRFNKIAENANKNSTGYKSSKNLMKYLGIDIDPVTEAINKNPDIRNVVEAMLVMVVPVNTKEQLEIRYLFEFFENVYDARNNDVLILPIASSINALQNKDGYLAASALIIRDKRFTMELLDSGVYMQILAGTIGAVGTYATDNITETFLIDVVKYIDRDSPSVTETITTSRVIHRFKKQITEGLYEEVKVVDLSIKYLSDTRFLTVGEKNSSNLVIPVDRSVTKKWSIPDKEILYTRSLHYLFTSVQEIEIKWYQTGIFQVLVLVVAIGIAFYTGQVQLVGAALAGSTAAAITLIQNILISIVIQQGLKIFVKAVGIEVAFVIAVVAALAGGYIAIEASSVAGAPWAAELLQLTNGLTTSIGDQLKDSFNALIADAATFEFLKSEDQKKLEAANNLLDNSTHLSPFVIFGEKPNEFYNRTIHSGNIGMLSISAISNYVDTALRLPKLNDTLGESTYA